MVVVWYKGREGRVEGGIGIVYVDIGVGISPLQGLNTFGHISDGRCPSLIYDAHAGLEHAL